MNRLSHPGARTTPEIRRAIRDSSESLQVLARRYGINPKTVAKWKKRADFHDLPAGPKPGLHRKLAAEEEETIVNFRKHTLLPLDDCLYALQAFIPHLRRSTIHRCFQRHGISRLAEMVETKDAGDTPNALPLGCFDIDETTVQLSDGSRHLFRAIDHYSKFVIVQMARHGGAAEAIEFLHMVVATSPFRIYRVLTPEAAPFASPDCPTEFTRVCKARRIEHGLIANPHSWTRERVTRMDRMIQDSATLGNESDFSELLRDFVHAYNYRRRLKALRGRTPYDVVCHAFTQEPDRFLRDPHHELVGPEFRPG